MYKYSLFFAAFIGVMFWSCKEDPEQKVILTLSLTAPVANETVDLSSVNSLTFAWTVESTISGEYTLLLSRSDDLTSPKTYSTNSTSMEITAADLNTVMKDFGFAEGAAGIIYWSVKLSSVDADADVPQARALNLTRLPAPVVLTQAEQIDLYRKEDVTIRFMQDGKPVANASIEIKMQQHEFLFGCGIFNWEGNSTPAEDLEYRRLFAELFNFATFSFYWGTYEPEKDKPNYAGSEKVAAWCAENGIRAKGHPLVYYDRTPTWANNLTDSELYQRIMNERIGGCTTHFSGSIDVWDVINEVVYWPAQTSPQAVSKLAAKIGYTEFAKMCFEAARKGNPDALLLINDNNNSDSYADILSRLTDSNGQALYDAIGIQSHFHMGDGKWPDSKILSVCNRFVKNGLGKPIHFTEMTILSTAENCGSCDNVPTSEAGEELQREEVVRVYTTLFAQQVVEAITWWDFSDQKSWLGAPSGLVRKNMTPKPAYNALKKLIKEDWATNETLVTDSNGEVHLRAFRGKYQFTITAPGGIKLSPQYGTVKKGEPVIELNVKSY